MKLCELTEEQYNSLKSSGMMWEFFPNCSGLYHEDCKVTKEHVLSELERFAKSSDTEGAHVDADQILCEFLKSLGYDDVVSAFNRIVKWYA